MKKILLSGLGGSLFPYLNEVLKHKFLLYYLDNDISLHALYPHVNFIHAPLVTENAYKDLVINLIKENSIDYYLPLIDEELYLAKKEMTEETSVHVIAPSSTFIHLCLNKYELMKFLKQQKISKIESVLGSEFKDQIEYPLFVKPVSGRGSRGIRKINSKRELEAYYILEGYDPKDVLVQPYVEGQEYTVGITVNNLNNILCISSKRILAKKGITKIAVTEINEKINFLAKRLVEIMKPVGPMNVQLFVTNDGEIKIFEINPRFSTTTILEIEAGVNVIEKYVETIDQEIINPICFPESGVYIHRIWESVFYHE